MAYNFIVDRQTGTHIHKSINIIETYFKEESYKIYDSNITDKELEYICVIGTQGYPSYNINLPSRNKHTRLPNLDLEDEQKISQNLLDKYHDGWKICFIFFTTDESDCPESPIIFEDYANHLNINPKHIYISNGNSLLESRKDFYNSKINVNSNNCIPRVMSGVMDRETKHSFVLEREKLFQCYNNMPKPWRFAIYTFFNKEHLLDKVDLSLLGHKHLLNQEKTVLLDILDNKIVEDWFNIGIKSIQNKKGLKSEFENFQFMNNGPQHDLTYRDNLYKHAYINIVTETQCTWDGIEHITEKSIQPFFFYQMPLIIATPHHVKSMKEKWGLDFFDDIINHSYDSIENHILRFHKITKEILRLSKMEDEIKEFVKNNQERFEKNKNIIKQIQHSQSDKNFWKSIKYTK
jgi:hypothetical protein